MSDSVPTARAMRLQLLDNTSFRRLFMKLPHPTHLLFPFILAMMVLVTGIVRGGNNHESADDVEDGRAELAAQIERNVEAGTRLMATARAQIHNYDEGMREEFLQIEHAVSSAETRLRRSLKSAQAASTENWSRARASLAANFEAYAQAIAQAERLITLGPASARRESSPR